jgi:hypothetical protein
MLDESREALATYVFNKYGPVTSGFIYALVTVFKMIRICLVMPEWLNSISDRLVH